MYVCPLNRDIYIYIYIYIGQLRVSVKFDFRYESLRSKFSFILFAYNLMIGGSKKKGENYPGKCF